jgi:hypothetical protein
MDFIVSLPKSHGSDSVLVVVDRFSKMAAFIPTTITVSAKEVAELLFANVFKFWGLPKDMLSDRDPKFVAKFWRELFAKLGAVLMRSSAYHSDTDGQTERANLELENYLRNYVDSDQKNWSTLLYMAEFRYNSQVHSATGFSPFFLATGRNPRMPIWFENPRDDDIKGSVPAVEVFLTDRLRAYEEATASITRAQRNYKEQSDKTRRDVVLKVGDLVKVHLEKHQFHKKISYKLAPRWFGPYKIIEKKGEKAYVLDLPPNLKMTPIFNVRRLELWKEDTQFPDRIQVLKPAPDVNPDGDMGYEVDTIIDHRSRNTRKQTRTEYLVKWKGYDHCENTWEPEWNLKYAQEVVNDYRKREHLD